MYAIRSYYDPDEAVAILHDGITGRLRKPLLDAQIRDADWDGTVGKGLGDLLLLEGLGEESAIV